MKNQSYRLVSLMSLLVMGCSQSLQLEKARWNANGPPPVRPANLDSKAEALSIGDKNLILQTQNIDGVEIEGSYYKEIRNSNPEFIAYKWASQIPMKLRSQILMMKVQSRTLANQFVHKHPEYDLKDLVKGPTLLLRGGDLLWRMEFQSRLGTLEGLLADRNLAIVEKKTLGSHIDTPTATLFPDGPLKSQLQRVLLAELMGNHVLVSPRVRILTQSPAVAESENAQFIFPVDDQRFEQVQVFFYLSKVLRWCESKMQFKLPFVLEAETSVGYPEKTNTAFYYQHKIRLGDGDDSVFSHIPLDPSIVTHESFHSVIEAVAGLPYEGEGGSLNEAFADIFTATLLENPKLGEASYKPSSFKRTVDNTLKLSEKNGGLYHDSGIVSGLLWSVQKSLGHDLGLAVAWDTLLHLTPDSHFAEFKTALKEATSKLSQEQQAQVDHLLEQRGWNE